jgi:hypothetical protein
MQPLPSSRNKDVSSEDAISSQIWLASTVYQNQASRNVPSLCNDPFRDQLETIRKLEEQNEQTRQQMVILYSTQWYENTYLDFISYLPYIVFAGAGIKGEV